MTGVRRGAAALGAVLLAAGCGSGGTAAAPTPSRPAAPTPPAPVPTSGPGAVPAPSPGATDFGYFPAVRSTSPVVLSFDRAVFLTGKEAEKAAAAHGDESFDYYVVNDNPLLRTVTLSPSVRVRGSIGLNRFVAQNDEGDDVPLREQDVASLLDFLATERGKHTPWHLAYGPGGTVVSIDEQYEP